MLMAWAVPGMADVYVIGHTSNAAPALSKSQVADLYLGRARAFPSGEFALIFDQPRDAEARQRFYQAYTGMALPQVNAYWSRLMFTGQVQPPLQLPDDRAVTDVVKRNPSAIGYVLSKPSDAGVRVLAHVPD